MVNNELIAKRLKIICDEYDLSAAAFAEKVHVGRATISHILSGRNKPSLEFILKVHTAFPTVDLYWLLYGQGNFPKAIGNQKNQTNLPEPDEDQNNRATIGSPPASEIIPPPSSTSKSEATSSSEIARVIIFYKDGHFESFDR